jgi:hypothetical protein
MRHMENPVLAKSDLAAPYRRRDEELHASKRFSPQRDTNAVHVAIAAD